MKTKISPTVVGAFVIGAFALLIVAMLAFGGINFFAKPQRFIVHFNESIHGLDLGSPVKLRGVRVGRVVALNIRYDDRTNQSVVAVVCELSKDVMTDTKGVVLDVASRTELQTLVDRGLRAQLEILGLATGLLYVELDFFDVDDHPVDPSLTDPTYVVVPSVQSTIAGFYEATSEILAGLKGVDFVGLSREAGALMVETRMQLESIDLKAVGEQWTKTGAEFEALARRSEFDVIFENLNGVVEDLRATIAHLDGQIGPRSQELSDTLAGVRETVQAFNATAQEARSFIAMHSGLGGEFVGTLQHINEAVDAVKRLADFLERNPNALITGRKRPD
jgi:paraquat-inducible protein B